MRIRSLSLSLVLVACAPRATSLAPDHPASANAPTGRLAGPPPALRPGVAETVEPAAPDPAPTGHEHHMPAAQPPAPAQPAETKEPAPAPTEPKKAEPKKTEPKKAEPKKTEPKKPDPKPVPDPHEHH